MELSSITPSTLFRAQLNKGVFYQLFNEYIKDHSAVGKDGIRVEIFEKRYHSEIDIILRKIKNGSYEFTSYREKLISKGAGKKPRQISIPTVRDKLVLKFVSELLTIIYPEHVSKPPHELVKDIKNISGKAPKNFKYLRLDIENYYPSIDHEILIRTLRKRIRIPELLFLIINAIKTPTGEKKDFDNLPTFGVPQGLSISNILSSLYLESIDHKYKSIPSIKYYRFVDDILIIADSETCGDLSKNLPVELEAKKKITCHKVGEGNKSILVSINNGVDYLGYRFCGKSVEVRQSSFKKMFSNLMKYFTIAKYNGEQAAILWRINLRITGCHFQGKRIGWIFFFSQTENVQQLKQLDAFVADQARKFIKPKYSESIKQFVRAYYEIRYNHRESNYFLDFDDFTPEKKIAEIKMLLGSRAPKNLESFSPEALDKYFNKCITREISDLERDMLEVFS